MNIHYRKFYRACYQQTGGFMPVKPLIHPVFPGDFFQIRNGEMVMLGNIFRLGMVRPEEVLFSDKTRQNALSWQFGEGASKAYSGRGHGQGAMDTKFEYSKQKFTFESAGSFFFKANHPELIKIANWSDFSQSLIIKFTQTMFSFRKLYVVTETVSTEDWTLAVAGNDHADLEIATETENFGLTDIFGHPNSRTVQMHGMEYYHHHKGNYPTFFKAKKLVIHDEPVQEFIGDLMANRLNHDQWAAEFFNWEMPEGIMQEPYLPVSARACMLDMLTVNTLNPNTALNYFQWANASLDDVTQLFSGYGHS